jgi:hypothetical protein
VVRGYLYQLKILNGLLVHEKIYVYRATNRMASVYFNINDLSRFDYSSSFIYLDVLYNLRYNKNMGIGE